MSRISVSTLCLSKYYKIFDLAETTMDKGNEKKNHSSSIASKIFDNPR